ncbi:MAG: PfkB family carbohydrate kinase, partial [Armatimonadetes bacterium]|nr:PfkB family carbohydrate kinase [Armatimonadota bacterium]
MRTAPGGKGANQAVACSRLGADTVMVGRVGEDEFGPKLRNGLASDGVDVAAVRVDPDEPSGVALILLDESGNNRIIVIKGANARLGEEEVAAAANLLDGTDSVLMPLEVPLPVVKAVAEAARARGVRSVLDAGPATPAAVAAGLPRLVDLFSPNQTEAEAFTGVPVRDLEGARKAAVRL